MPAEEDLPPDLAVLARRNAATLVDADWRSGLARLVAALRRIVEPVDEPELITAPPAELAQESGSSPLASIPALATILAVAGAAALIAGTWLEADLWAHPSPNRGDRDGLGYFTSVAPMTIVVGAVGSLLLSYSRGVGRLGTGLFLGFALAGVARYVSVLGVFPRSAAEETSREVAGAWLALAGCVLLVAAAAFRLAADREERDPGAGWLPRALVLGGAALVVVGAAVPLNDAATVADPTLLERNSGWNALEPLAAAGFAAAISFGLPRRRAAASGALIALGIFLTLLWSARYIGYPAWQPDEVSSVAEGGGGFIGFAGGVAILAGGLVARPRLRGGRTSSVRPVEEVS